MLALDTGIIIEIEKGNQNIIKKILELRETHPQNMAVTSHTYAEFYFGVVGREYEKKDIVEKINALEIIIFDKESAKIFAKLRKNMLTRGKQIPLFDLLAASSIINTGAILITKDNHFKEIPGLNVIFLE